MGNKYFKIITNNVNGMQLFCFPYAGGNAAIYNPWKSKLDDCVSLIAVNLPGRANLYNEDLIVDLDLLVDLLYKAIKPYLSRPFAFFGHSMGGILAYALASHIEKNDPNKPEFIIVSATKPPHFYYGKQDYLLSDDELKKKLIDHNATPAEILNSTELMKIILPIYRADYALLEKSKIEANKIDTKVFLFNCEDDIEKNTMMEWQGYFSHKVTYFEFDGGHFFIHKSEEEMIGQINHICSDT